MEAKLKLILITTAALTLSTTFAQADCNAEIKAMMDAHIKAGPYHVTMDQQMASISMKTEADVILPDSFHMKNSRMETVLLPAGAWMKIGGKWTAMPAAMSTQVALSIKSNMDTSKMNLANAQCLGAQQIEGQTLTAYSFDSSAEIMGTKATSHITAYKNSNDLPAIMMVEGEALGHKSKTVQHITYDPSITISPPN